MEPLTGKKTEKIEKTVEKRKEQEYTYQAFEKAQLNQKHQAEKNKLAIDNSNHCMVKSYSPFAQ